ncbi:MAG TPA: DUF4233 domain-containing protein [Corynebacterium urealyticum]|uniref:DUF4233 domain-containing protein n=1 Tax=Candidatus Corynebacterium intestinavium TaxID=2838531 RepID=A0A9D2ZR36_9CORY|nr:DUF4233 domain-containing protein [Candidatus Corynebacterium intestinavium]HJD89938.1 DUF4233 domain-containing protein [Corynebacterium urealyticum]
MARKPAEELEMGPLGPGHAPANDPMKGIRGVMAGTLILEGIVMLLGLTVVGRVDSGLGPVWLQFGYVLAVAVLMFAAAFMQKADSADKINWGLQILALIGVFANLVIGVMALIFIGVWWYIYHLRKVVQERMRRGLLPSQHV